jgi:hypothetical protein
LSFDSAPSAPVIVKTVAPQEAHPEKLKKVNYRDAPKPVSIKIDPAPLI